MNTIKTATIQVESDVKAKLDTLKEEKQTYNDVLRGLLDMNEKIDHFAGRTPNRYEAEITKHNFRCDDPIIHKFIESLPLTPEQIEDIACRDFSDRILIGGVDVSVTIDSTMIIELEAPTLDEMNEQIAAITPHIAGILPKLDKNNLDVSAWYCCSEEKLVSMGA